MICLTMKYLDGNSNDSYAGLREQYEDTRTLMHRKLGLVLQEIEQGNSLLDIGCGTGDLILRVIPRFPFVLGTDINPRAVHGCKERMQQGSRVNFLTCDAEKLPLRPSIFDYVTALDVLEHLNNPSFAIREAYRILRPKGKFIVTTPNWYDKIGINQLLARKPNLHKNAHSSFGWRKLLRREGFEIENIRTVSFPFIDKEFLAKGLHMFGKCVLAVAQKKSRIETV